ncbi:hypothetical protein L1987_57992 [Smallanthus sonchifolius]|uniref:Uncharacterized protein n=1 Tax=Smallanthus sonchifolius TaxID=185202 RepID=A0ACB9DF53_9ASTR|nr:hypothetical protein L1987_57992 [Smallanthus sonchifolius]
METVIQTIDADIGTTNKPPRLQPASETDNLNTFTLEEVYETLQNYEFKSKGFHETVVSKPVGATLIAPVMESMPETMAYSQVPPTPVVHASYCKAPKDANTFKANFGNQAQASAPVSKHAALISQQTNYGLEGYDWSAHSEVAQHNQVNQALMADIKGKDSAEKVSQSTSCDNDEIALYKHHNQIFVDELNKALETNNYLKEAEKLFKEKIEALTKDHAAMTYNKNVLEIQ